jgi:DNA-binding transcriptional ArsR family regulator
MARAYGLDRDRARLEVAVHSLKCIYGDAYIQCVSTDVFVVVADPTRRRILNELVHGERSVGDLVGVLGLSQPTVSKHLKVLRESGFVVSRNSAQRRIYRLDQQPFRALDDWLGPYRSFWNRQVDALEKHLDNLERNDE